MKKIILLCGILLILIQSGLAQIDDIKKKSLEHRDKRGNDPDISFSESPGDDIVAACLGGCLEICFSEIGAAAFSGLITLHSHLLDKRDSDPTIVSLDIMPTISYDPSTDIVDFLPRIRGTWGAFASDFRFNYLTQFDDYQMKVYQTINWQVFILNIASSEKFNLRIGTGWLYDYVSELDFNEHSLSMEFRFKDQAVTTMLEGRGAWDYATSDNIFHEVDLKTNFRIFENPHLWGYSSVGLVYQNYYLTKNFFMVEAGMKFNIH